MKTVRYGDWLFHNNEIQILLPKAPWRMYFPICSFGNPCAGGYLVSRRTEGWQLAPVVFTPDGHGKKVADMPFILLTNSPDAVNAEIENYLKCQTAPVK